MPKEKQEHIAIVNISVAVFTKDSKGGVNGPVMNQQEMESEHIPHTQRFVISGFDKFECIKKIKGIYDGLSRQSEDG